MQLDHDGTKEVKLQIWDLSGQDRYIVMSRPYFHNADGVALVVDLSQLEQTMEHAKKWKTEVYSRLDKDIPCILLANKYDKIEENEENLKDITDKLNLYTKENNIASWAFTSIKHTNIDEPFNILTKLVFEDLELKVQSKNKEKFSEFKPERENSFKVQNTSSSTTKNRTCGGCTIQ
ncbi:hypothetical protein DFA_01257 [Cavenderia fasciculata]|uniref:Rab GTPase n=1 Tax=Cavenderia fasciculata TaxID=261658 RepID=F4PRU0_CACFS|nr:uncharacterized protein DFA_01257 [Cavenderia fasciculata]EGG21376.1 hypothetical protein DFA_01257 [Cavenderia fasciculata]|eukprot:XP_004359226.1 hypothetical protein DFA_01257 [Cavenderia fasciculata]